MVKGTKIVAKNPFKGFDTRSIKYAPGEFKTLINALEFNDKDLIVDIIYKIYLRGHLL